MSWFQCDFYRVDIKPVFWVQVFLEHFGKLFEQLISQVSINSDLMVLLKFFFSDLVKLDICSPRSNPFVYFNQFFRSVLFDSPHEARLLSGFSCTVG